MSENTEADIRALIPKHKTDGVTARAAIARGYPAVAPILPELMEWIQDMNWPIANTLAPFLAGIGDPLIPEVKRILQTTDYAWQYWVLIEIVANSPEIAQGIREELARLANNPTREEMWEDLHIHSAEILRELDSRKAKG